MHTTPVFVEYDPITGYTTVQDREFKSFQQALNVYRKEKDMNAYLQLLEAQQRAHHVSGLPIERSGLPEIESKQFKIIATVDIGQEAMIRMQAIEDIAYNLHDKKFEITEGTVTGWFLASPANVKSVLDRTAFIDEKSVIFGDMIGRVIIKESFIIGSVKDSEILKSQVMFSYSERSFYRSSQIIYGNVRGSRILHSTLEVVVAANSVVSSSDCCSCTFIGSRITDSQMNTVGLKDSNYSCVTMSESKVIDSRHEGMSDTIENCVTISVVQNFRGLLSNAKLLEEAREESKQHILGRQKRHTYSMQDYAEGQKWDDEIQVNGSPATRVPALVGREIEEDLDDEN